MYMYMNIKWAIELVVSDASVYFSLNQALEHLFKTNSTSELLLKICRIYLLTNQKVYISIKSGQTKSARMSKC